MKNSKSFNLFLIDGEVTGRIKCTMSNWTGLAYKVPRTYLDECKDRHCLLYTSDAADDSTEV